MGHLKHVVATKPILHTTNKKALEYPLVILVDKIYSNFNEASHVMKMFRKILKCQCNKSLLNHDFSILIRKSNGVMPIL